MDSATPQITIAPQGDGVSITLNMEPMRRPLSQAQEDEIYAFLAPFSWQGIVIGGGYELVATKVPFRYAEMVAAIIHECATRNLDTGETRPFLSALRLPKQPIPSVLRWTIWERDDFTCQMCGARSHLSIDHIIPESKGGLLVEANLQTLCRSCNSRKGAKTDVD